MKFRFWHNDRKVKTAIQEGWTEEGLSKEILRLQYAKRNAERQMTHWQAEVMACQSKANDLTDRLNWLKEQGK